MSDLGTEKKPVPISIRVDAKLVERGELLQLELAPDQVRPSDGYSSSWEGQRAYRSIQYRWQDAVGASLGRMHFTNYDKMEYQVVPVFESFGRATEILRTEATKEKKKMTSVEEKISPEEIISKVIEGIKLEEIAVRAAKSNLTKLFKADLGPDDSIESEGEVASLDRMTELVFGDLKQILIGSIKLRAREVKLKRVRKVQSTETFKVPELVFRFENGLEVHMENECASLFSLLLPAIQLIKERLGLVRKWRNEGVTNGDFDYEPKGELIPFEHQKVMYKVHMTLDRSANLGQMGTGKSLAVLMAIDKRIQLGQVRRGHVLIICPATLCETWHFQHIKKGAPHLTSEIITGSYGDRLEIVSNRTKDIYIANFETFTMKLKMPGKDGKTLELLMSDLFSVFPWDMVVIDEAHKIKSPEAQRTKNILKTFLDVPYKIIMSGTINANKLFDLHMPFCFLNRAKHFNSVQTRRDGTVLELSTLHEQFVSAYFNGTGFRKDPKPFTILELRERMEEIAVRYEKSECFDLPAKMYEQRMIDMDPKQAQLYLALKNCLIAELSGLEDRGGTITVMNLLAMMVKLAEAANGWIYDNNHQLITLKENPKLNAVMDCLSDVGDDDKVVIWSRFTHDLHLIQAAISKEYGADSVAIMHGGEHCTICGARKDERYEITKRFNDEESPLKFVVVNSAVGSHGIDLTGATYEFFFSNSFVKTDRQQAEDRCHRYGMRDRLTIIDFVMKDTVDESVLQALKSWKTMSAALLGHLGVELKSTRMEDGGKDAPVVIEHIMQRPGECALVTISMLSNVPVDLIRSYMNVSLGDCKAYKGLPKQILFAVEKYLPEMKEQWEQYTAHQAESTISLAEMVIPKTGSGVVITQHEKAKLSAHAIAYSNGFVYDPGNGSKVSVDEYAAWMVRIKYNINWVFTLSEGRTMVLPECVEELK